MPPNLSLRRSSGVVRGYATHSWRRRLSLVRPTTKFNIISEVVKHQPEAAMAFPGRADDEEKTALEATTFRSPIPTNEKSQCGARRPAE